MRALMAAALAACLAGCGSIESDYIDLNERAYRSVGADFLDLVAATTAEKAERKAMVAALDSVAQVVSDTLVRIDLSTLAPDDKAAETAKVVAVAKALERLRAFLPRYDRDEAQTRADSIRAWHGALMEARHHAKGGDQSATREPLPLPLLPWEAPPGAPEPPK